MTKSDWDTSASAWLAHLGHAGDRGRTNVLDAPMLAAVRKTTAKTAIDVGCGEGRFCRMMEAEGIQTTGVDPTQALLDVAQQKQPAGTYVNARAESLPFKESTFDLCVSYVTLIDIPDHLAAISEMARVTRPGGYILVANLQSNATARHREARETDGGWIYDAGTPRFYAVDDVLDERSFWSQWCGIHIKQYHRPLSSYMQAFLDVGLELVSFSEPPFVGGDPHLRERYNRMPWFVMMAWRKPVSSISSFEQHNPKQD